MIAPPMIQRTFGFTRLLGASSGTLAHPHGRLVGRRSPAPGAVGPVRRERALAIPAASLAGRRRPPISTRRADAGLLRLGLIDAFLELLETRPKRSRELREPVRPEQDQHDDQDDQQFLRTKSKHPWDSSAEGSQRLRRTLHLLYPSPRRNGLSERPDRTSRTRSVRQNWTAHRLSVAAHGAIRLISQGIRKFRWRPQSCGKREMAHSSGW